MSKTLKRIVVVLITLISILLVTTKVLADEYDTYNTKNDYIKYFDKTRMLPARNVSGATGLLPQYYNQNSQRTISLNKKRTNLNTDDFWDGIIKGETVYCALHHSYVRYGTFDAEKHYLSTSGVKLQGTTYPSYINEEDTVQADINKKLKAEEEEAKKKINLDKKDYEEIYSSEQIKYEIISKDIFYRNQDAILDAYGIFCGNTLDTVTKGEAQVLADRKAAAATKMGAVMSDVIKNITGAITSKEWSYDVDGEKGQEVAITENIKGPEIVIMEREAGNHSTNGYSRSNIKEEYKTSKSNEAETVKAYILTALENSYNSEIGTKYSLTDIQAAYWHALHVYDGGRDVETAKYSARAQELYNNAYNYAKYIQSNQNVDYTTSIDTSKAKVIANRNEKTYIVGPFTLNYPNYYQDSQGNKKYFNDFSYVKALNITAGGTTLKYNGIENKKEFDLILEDGGISASGIGKVYPKSGEKFFIKIDANKIQDASSIKLSADFEYLNNAQIEYNKMDSKAQIYAYLGIISAEGIQQASATRVDISATVQYKISVVESKFVHKDGCVNSNNTNIKYCMYCSGKVEEEEIESKKGTYSSNYSNYYLQPYIQMTEEPIKKDLTAQKFIVTNEGKRDYKTKTSTTEEIDLSMELGGKVWVDEETGKESVANGIKDSSEKLVPNVIVTLYKQDGTRIAETKTNNNGEYRFTGLNAMYKYYVKFTYNGQYYEPTYYTSPLDGTNGWNKGNWQNNSNATDKINEREVLNKKFESIGSYPNNYYHGEYGTTYTKEQLLNAKVIDEFGNLIMKEDAPEAKDAEIKSMITYVKECRMDAYTGNNTKTGGYAYDTYPIPDIFMIDDGGKIVFMKLDILDSNYKISKVRQADINMLYPSAYYINLGLHPREDADLALKKDIDNVTLEINGQTHKYTYDTLENKTNQNGEETWDISVRLSDTYYNTAYSRELYKEDYLYKASSYGNEEVQKEYGKTKNDELNVYITYKIMVRNQAISLKARVDEIVDYYDPDLEYVANRSYIQIKNGTNNIGKYLVVAEENSNYDSVTSIDGYKKLYVKGLGQNAQKINDAGENDGEKIADGLYLDGGQTAYVYLTFKVAKDNRDGEEWVRLDENYANGVAIGVGKENIAEINGYSTKYAEGTKVPNIGDVSGKPAGKVDKDSNPGNLNPVDVPKDGTINYENFEDDTDKAPNIRIILDRDDNKTRVISGSVFEDSRTNEIGVATVGNGFKEDKETLINGVTVQLVELMENGKEFVWREFGSTKNGTETIGTGTGTGNVTEETPIINAYNLIQNYKFNETSHKGEYAFKSFAPGKYVVRFIYGDTVKTVVPNVEGGNAKSYNGQDYKSTTYQKGVEQNKTYTWNRNTQYVNGQEILSNKPEDHYTISTFKPDASNNETANFETKQANAYLYDITASDSRQDLSDAKDIASRREEVINYSNKNVTNYIAEVLASHKTDYETLNDKNTLLKDLMQNTKMTAQTGVMVIELEKDQEGTDGNNKQNIYQITNVDLGLEERPKAQLVIEKEVSNVKLTLADGSILFDASKSANNVLWRDHKGYDLGYKGNLLNETKFGSIENIRKNNASSFGLIQLSMDEELMHGATIKVDYAVTVKNVGEVDYKDNKFYYTGEKSDTAKIVTTTANKVIDYVANNLQFYAKDNSNWKVITTNDIKNNGLVNDKLEGSIEQYSTIIVTEDLAKDLVPELYKEKVDKNAQSSVSVPLVLTQLITAENDGDDLTYRNIAEIVQTSNTVGRRMEYSVVGNQDPLKEPQELDTSKAEVIKILPPFGGIAMYVLISVVALAGVAIIVTGVIFIKKKVLRK